MLRREWGVESCSDRLAMLRDSFQEPKFLSVGQQSLTYDLSEEDRCNSLTERLALSRLAVREGRLRAD